MGSVLLVDQPTAPGWSRPRARRHPAGGEGGRSGRRTGTRRSPGSSNSVKARQSCSSKPAKLHGCLVAAVAQSRVNVLVEVLQELGPGIGQPGEPARQAPPGGGRSVVLISSGVRQDWCRFRGCGRNPRRTPARPRPRPKLRTPRRTGGTWRRATGRPAGSAAFLRLRKLMTTTSLRP